MDSWLQRSPKLWETKREAPTASGHTSSINHLSDIDHVIPDQKSRSIEMVTPLSCSSPPSPPHICPSRKTKGSKHQSNKNVQQRLWLYSHLRDMGLYELHKCCCSPQLSALGLWL